MKNVKLKIGIVLTLLSGLFIVLLACGGGGGSAYIFHPEQPATTTEPQPSLQAGDSKDAFESFVSDLKANNITGIQEKFDPTAWEAGMKDIVLASDVDLVTLGSLFEGATLEVETDEAAYYIARRTEDGKPITYHIQMVKVNGIWKIAGM